MHVIAVANQKGGVGKTTTALSLAASLAADGGERVVAVDLDPQGNLTEGAGVGPDAEPPSLYEVLAARTPLGEAARPIPHEALPTLDLVPAGSRLAQAEAELLGQVGFDEVLKARLGAEDRWATAVLDCPPSLGALTVNALGAADLVVVPVQCEYFSARGVVKLMELVELVRERRNPGLGVRIVPTLYDRRNNICRAVLSELRRSFGEDVSDVVVGVDTKVRASQARRVPVPVDAPRSRAAQAYAALARESAAWRGGARVQAA